MSNDKAPEPMDPSAREGASPEFAVRNVRRAYALDTLVAEVFETFGEVPVVYGAPDDFQVIHEVTFDATGIDNLVDTLTAIYHDDRLLEVDCDAEETNVYISIVPNRRTRDSRESWGIDAIWASLPKPEPTPAPTPAPAAPKPAPPRKRAPRKTAAKKTES